MQALLDAIDNAPAISAEAQRVFHGRGGLHPGCEAWTLDIFPPVWVLTSFVPVDEAWLHTIHGHLQQHAQRHPTDHPLTWVVQQRGPGSTNTRVMAGQVPELHTVSEDGARYSVHLLKGQNHGLFLDMAEGRRWVRQHVAQRVGQQRATTPVGGTGRFTRFKVLNLFAYTCGFSVAALLGGASEVLNVDMASGALATGQHNHALNGLQGRARFMAHDVFSSWGKLTRSGPYELVVVDPPSFQKGSFVATKDYARLVRRLPDLLAPGGHALLCLNAPELDTGFLHALVQAHAPGLRFLQRLPNPQAFADQDPERALKVLVFEMAFDA